MYGGVPLGTRPRNCRNHYQMHGCLTGLRLPRGHFLASNEIEHEKTPAIIARRISGLAYGPAARLPIDWADLTWSLFKRKLHKPFQC
jgi:hypothetical protein